MMSSNGNGVGATRRAKMKSDARHANGGAVKLSPPIERRMAAAGLPKLAMALAPPAPPPPPPPTTSSTIGASRGTGSITLWYSIHSVQPITYVSVRIQALVGGVGSGSKVVVQDWCLNYINDPTTDADLQPTTHILGDQDPTTNPLLILVTYNTAIQQNIPAFSISA